MDTSIISGLSAVLGSLVGGSASLATAWLTQTTQGRHERSNTETLKREALCSEFIAECVKLTSIRWITRSTSHPRWLRRLRC
jgi:hypothetical protein